MRRRLSDAEASRVLEAERKRRRQWLSEVPIFAALASQDNAEQFLTAVAEKLEVQTVGRKECVVSKGEYGAEMYFIVRFCTNPAHMYHDTTGWPTNNPKFAESLPMMRVMSASCL